MGDTIEIGSGIYAENVVVDKAITLVGVDTGAGRPVVNGGGSTAIRITADNAIVRGFNVTGGTGNEDGGIKLEARYVTVADNVAYGNNYGIYLKNTRNGTIANNTANGNTQGICLKNAKDNRLINNTANDNTQGIYLNRGSDDNYLTENTANNNSDIGFYIFSDNNNLTGNNASFNPTGFSISGSTGNNLTANTANSNADFGIYLASGANGNNMTANTVSNNDYGIYLAYSEKNKVTENTASGNNIGIGIAWSSGNTLWQNALAGNTVHASATNGYVNSWNSDSQVPYNYYGHGFTGYTGNYWDDNARDDSNIDGACDSPYTISTGNVDNYPMITAIPVTADFRANVTGGVVPVTVQFNDTSTGLLTAWQWSFGDGTANATARNVTHTFAVPGTFTVTLTVTDPRGDNTTQKAGYVTVMLQPPVADFTANRTGGSWPLCVQFTDRSLEHPGSRAHSLAMELRRRHPQQHRAKPGPHICG